MASAAQLAQVGDVLGLTSLAGGLVSQIPQIMGMVKNKDAEGISFAALSIEICSLTIQVLYNLIKSYPLTAYGDTIALLLQDYIIIGLILLYAKEKPGLRQYGNIVLYVGVMCAIVQGTITKDMIVTGMNCVLMINIVAKATYIADILRNKNTDNMNPIGWILFLYSNLVRMFTSYVVLGDMTVFAQHSFNFSSNLLITAMIYYYKTGEKKEKEKKEE